MRRADRFGYSIFSKTLWLWKPEERDGVAFTSRSADLAGLEGFLEGSNTLQETAANGQTCELATNTSGSGNPGQNERVIPEWNGHRTAGA